MLLSLVPPGTLGEGPAVLTQRLAKLLSSATVGATANEPDMVPVLTTVFIFFVFCFDISKICGPGMDCPPRASQFSEMRKGARCSAPLTHAARISPALNHPWAYLPEPTGIMCASQP